MAKPIKSVTHRSFGDFINSRRSYPTDGRTIIRQNARTVDVRVFGSKEEASEAVLADRKKHEGAGFMTAKMFAVYTQN
jgi:hypothetical protein